MTAGRTRFGATGEPGRGMALAATIIGWIGTVAWFVFWGVFLSTLHAISG